MQGPSEHSLVTAQATSPWSWPGTQLPVESDQAHPWAVGQGHWLEPGLPEKIALRVYLSLRSLRKIKSEREAAGITDGERWRYSSILRKWAEDASELFRNLYHQKHLLAVSPESEFPKSQQWKGEGGKNWNSAMEFTVHYQYRSGINDWFKKKRHKKSLPIHSSNSSREG